VLLGLGVFYVFMLGVVILRCCSEVGTVLLFCSCRCFFAGVVVSGVLCLGVVLFNKKTVFLGVAGVVVSQVLLFLGCCYSGVLLLTETVLMCSGHCWFA